MKGFLRKYLARERERRKRKKDSSPYTFFTIKQPGYLSVTRNRIGLHESEYFRKELIRYLESYKQEIILDTSHLDDLDCAGIAAIVRAEAAARKNGTHITLEGLHGRAENAAKIMGLNRFLTSNYPR